MAKRNRLWGFDDDERAMLVAATAEIPTLRAVVGRAERRAEFRNLWVVEASVGELDEMYTCNCLRASALHFRSAR
jgi:hypothetical protein